MQDQIVEKTNRYTETCMDHQTALQIWCVKTKNVTAALLKRARHNSLAWEGKYSSALEQEIDTLTEKHASNLSS